MESRGLLACVKEFVLINEKLNESSRDTHCIAENVVALNRSLGEEISDIRDSVKEAAIDVVSSSVDRLSSSVTTIASNAEQASENVETMSVEAGEMRQIIVDVNANLEQVGSLVSGVARSIEEMDASLNEVRERCRISGTESRDALRSAKEATDVIHKLADSTKEIGRVLNAISTIAQQTKLLALNASIEAAHAGSAGRGFAIVAQQVKELSMQTKDATDMIAGLVKEIGAGTDEAIRAISSMADLNERIDENAQEIAESIEQQSVSTTEIRHSIEAVTDSTALVMGDARAVRQKSEIVAGAAGTAAQKTDDIARLTAGAAEAAADIARKTREARAFIMNILESAEKTDAVSKVVSESLGDTFQLAATMRSLVMSMNSMVEIVRDVSGTLHEVQTGLDVGDAAFDIEEVKGDYLRWMVDLQRIANAPDSARSAELRARALGRGALREWIEANAGTGTAMHPRFEDIVEGERRTHELIVETLESAGGDDPGACRDRVAAYLDEQRRLFADLDVLYQTMDASVSLSAQIPQVAPVAESPAPAREPAYVA
jgi:hemerythrin